MNILVLDVETTGLDPEKHRVVELAAVPVYPDRPITIRRSTLVDPEMTIPPEARGIHHISDDDVKGKPLLEDALLEVTKGYRTFVPAAHNKDFDSKFLPGLEGEWICTWRCAKHIWPEAPSHSNQTLRYWLELFSEPAHNAMPPHRAGPDAWVTAHILKRMLEGRTAEDLLALTKAPILLRTVHFGKHRGEDWSKVPKDYLRWILNGRDFDPDVVHTAKHYFNGGVR